ncbi:SWIB/MDM2 domain-containing protein [Aphelenchoides bicaudatus]|nr:SWIB/MDM2 domain-containing protein [Aphelenchoides bicaudatus]
MALPVDRSVLSRDILDLVRHTDLNSLTSKYVRTRMEAKHNVKLGDFRKEIDFMIRDSIEAIESGKSPKPENGTANNNSSKSDSKKVAKLEINNVEKRDPSPPPKAETPISLADFEFEEDNDKFSAIKRRRATQRPVVQRKSATKRTKQDDEGAPPRKKTAFTKLCVLSDDLSALLNRKYMRRADVVKLMWEYFRKNNLLDPKDRRFVIFDEPMKAVFGMRRIQAFGMMKVLKNHIKDLEFLDEDTRRTAMHEIELLEENGELEQGSASFSSKASKPAAKSSAKPSKPPTKTSARNARNSKPSKSSKPSKTFVHDSDSSDSSSSEEEEKPSTSPKLSANNNHVQDNASPSTSKLEPKLEPKLDSKLEEPRTPKLVLRISKKTDRVVSVKVNDDEEAQQAKNARANVSQALDNGSSQNLSSNASTADLDGPPQLDLEVPNDASSSGSSSGSSSSGSSSGSSSSGSASSSPERPAQNNNVVRRNLNNDLDLSESDSD